MSGSKRRQEGYLLIDNSASPGITPEVARSFVGKPWVPTPGEGEVYESATITCSQCQRVVILNPNRTRPRHYCQKCDHYVCDSAGCVVECTPMLKTLDVAMAAQFKEMNKKGVI